MDAEERKRKMAGFCHSLITNTGAIVGSLFEVMREEGLPLTVQQEQKIGRVWTAFRREIELLFAAFADEPAPVPLLPPKRTEPPAPNGGPES